MQTVSDAWKAEQQKKIITAESLLEISMSVGDPDAQMDATASANGQTVYSNVEQVADQTEKSPVRYATLEKNLWLLDGTFVCLPDGPPYGDNGYIGNVLSGDDGRYSTPPTITVSFSKVFTELIPGVTVKWATAYDEWASSFRVTAYSGETVTAQTTITNNDQLQSVVLMDISEYDRITIEVLEWCRPYRRARVESVLVGIEKIYSKADVISFTHGMSVDPMSADLPKAEIKFEVKNLNGEYDPDNPSGPEKYLMERQAVKVRYGYRLSGQAEWIAGGTFYMSEWETPQNGITASFTARDLLEYMTDKYSGTSSGSLQEIATDALTQAGLPLNDDGTVLWSLWGGLSDITAPSGVDLSEYTIAEVLQLVANAACCVLYQDRDGVLHIEPLPSGETDERIDRNVSYANAEMTLTKQLKAVNVNSGAAVVSNGSVGETQPVDNPLISDARASTVAQWAVDYLKNRRVYSGNWRADPRLDVLDRVTVGNQFADSVVLLTEIECTFNGAWRGSYEGRGGV